MAIGAIFAPVLGLGILAGAGADPLPPPVQRDGGGTEIQRGDREDDIRHAHRPAPTTEHHVVADHAGADEANAEINPSEVRQPSWWHVLYLPSFPVPRGGRSHNYWNGDQVFIRARVLRRAPGCPDPGPLPRLEHDVEEDLLDADRVTALGAR
jgi:hypothetical protein